MTKRRKLRLFACRNKCYVIYSILTFCKHSSIFSTMMIIPVITNNYLIEHVCVIRLILLRISFPPSNSSLNHRHKGIIYPHPLPSNQCHVLTLVLYCFYVFFQNVMCLVDGISYCTGFEDVVTCRWLKIFNGLQ